MNNNKFFIVMFLVLIGIALIACAKTGTKETPTKQVPAQNTQSSGAPSTTVDVPDTEGIDDINTELNDSSLNNVSKDLDAINW
jgi:hypothetical protein